MANMKYVGPIPHLKGQTAIVRVATHGKVVAQFDNRKLLRSGKPWPQKMVKLGRPPMQIDWMIDDYDTLPDDALGYGWHLFNPEDFENAESGTAGADRTD